MATRWCANGHQFDEALPQCPICGAGSPRGWDRTLTPPPATAPMASSTAPEPSGAAARRSRAACCVVPVAIAVGALCLGLVAVVGWFGLVTAGQGEPIAALLKDGLTAFPGLGKEGSDATPTPQTRESAERRAGSPTALASPTTSPPPAESTPAAYGTPSAGASPVPTGSPGGGTLPGRSVTVSTPPGIPVRCAVVGNGVETSFDLAGGGTATVLLPPGVYTFTCSSRVGVVGFALPVFTITVPEAGGIAVPAVALPFLIVSVS